jgi:hypothetical protein
MAEKLEPRVYTLDEISEEEFTKRLLAEDWPEWTPSEQFARDQEWIEEHMAEFVQEYPDQWVAVYHQQIIAASPDLGVVQKAANEIEDYEVTIFFVEGRIYVY